MRAAGSSRLGRGVLEQVYQNALMIELQEAGFEVLPQAPIEVRYRDQVVGVYRADLVVDGLVIIEIKAVEHLQEAHEVQLVNYLRATNIEVGLLVNFAESWTSAAASLPMTASPHLDLCAYLFPSVSLCVQKEGVTK